MEMGIMGGDAMRGVKRTIERRSCGGLVQKRERFEIQIDDESSQSKN